MKYDKIMFMLVLAIFIFGAASVCASDVSGTVIASEDTGQMELSAGNENEIVERASNEEVIGEGNVGTFQELQENITQGYASGHITLDKDYEYEDEFSTDGITITQGITIDGQGHKIDAKGKARIFNIETDNVILKNITFLNGKSTDGGAINWKANYGSVLDCRFENNTATGNGGAVYFWNSGDVTNCNFTNNTAEYGGAIRFYGTGTAINCNFINNTASIRGGALLFADLQSYSKATICTFINNSALNSGAIGSANRYLVIADTCIFKTNSDTRSAVIRSPTLNVNNFTTVYGSGEKLTFDLKTNSSIPVTNGNISISVYFKGNGEWVRNYTCLSGEGWIPDLPVGSYIAFFDTEYAGFQKINRTITITAPEHTFWFLNYTINGNDNPVIELSHDFYFDPAYDAAFVNGIVINRPVTIKGNGNAIDAKRQARIFYVQSANAVLENLTIKNANYNGNGGAIYFDRTGTVTNCNFTNNSATKNGGAIRMYSGSVENCNFTDNHANYGGAVFSSTGNVTNCNFTGNAADYGGAVYFYSTGDVTNCNFTDNNASEGSAIYFFATSASKSVSNSRFLNNRANAEALEVTINDNNITITFTGQNNLLNAIYSRNDAEVTFTNVTYWGSNGINNTGSSATIPSRSNKAAGQNITVGVVVNDKLVSDNVYVTDENGAIVLNIAAGDNYYITARHDTDSYYTEAEKTISNNTKFNVNVTSQTTNNKTVNITAKSNIFNEAMPGKLLFILPNNTEIGANYATNGTWWAEHTFDAYGVYKVNASYIGLDNVAVSNGTVTVLPTVNATDLIKVFRNGTQFYATFKDSNGDYLPEGTMVRFNIHGEFYDRQVSDDKGLVKLNINIQQGQYVITSMNLVTGENASNNVTVISRLVENNDLTKYYRNASQYTVKVIGDDGNAVGAGEIVTFNVHGVLYNRTTNESGIAKLNINLGPGDYIITAEHKDCRVSNNITVLPVLTAKDLTKKYGTPDQFIANLVDGQGNPFAGETVQFNVNGVLYDRVTDSNGQAKLNIRLMPGKYIITSSYNGASISNNIIVSA